MTQPPSPDDLRAMILAAIPDADVHVRTYSGNDHFEMQVNAAAFAGKTRIAQHQMVYAALGDCMKEAVHALALKTSIKTEHS